MLFSLLAHKATAYAVDCAEGGCALKAPPYDPVIIEPEEPIIEVEEVLAPTTTVRAIIINNAQKYALSETLLLAIAKAESGLNPWAKNKNSSASGIFQWINSSWRDICRPLGFSDVHNPKENVECAAITIKKGGLFHWSASRYGSNGWEYAL